MFLLHLGQAFASAAKLSEEAAVEMNRLASDVWFSYLERHTMPFTSGGVGVRVRDDFRLNRFCVAYGVTCFARFNLATRIKALVYFVAFFTPLVWCTILLTLMGLDRSYFCFSVLCENKKDEENKSAYDALDGKCSRR